MATSTARVRARPDGRAEPPAAVLAIVVTHQGRPWIRSCLASLSAQTYGLMDILVVDDASPDHREEPPLRRIVKRHCRRRRWGYLRTARPLGFGGAINWALGRIRTDADLLLFMHDDAALDPTAVERMVHRLASDRRSAIVGPKIVSWDDPARLEEVGMAVDRFGYPYKGLDRGEIDLGQHDHPSEVFFVTSTCMVMRHEVFRKLHGWDAQMRAFSEDLDLCWRARVAGHSVRVEPGAKARHAIALATGRRRSQFVPTRYFIRRNRLRSVVKNASTARLFWLLPQFVLLAVAEMLGFIVLRQYGEIINIARALGWNLLRAPQTLAARLRVQRERNVADRSLTRLTVRESTRLRAYIGHQAERLEEAWGRRAELLSERSMRMKAARRRLSGWPVALAAALVLALLVGWRNYLWAAPASVGQLLPYPEDATAVLGGYLAPWRDVGLGQPGPAPPALLPLGLFPLLSLGLGGLDQKLLVVTLVAAGGLGAHRLMGDLVPLLGRWVAASVYVLGGVAYAGLRQGSLGTLLLGAALPFGLHSLLRITGWIRPPAYDAGAEIARLAIAAGIAASLAPGALVLLLAAGVMLALVRWLMSAASPLGGIGGAAAGVAAGWALLLPWSATWWSPGGALDVVAAQARAPDSLFGSAGMSPVLLGQVPSVPELAGFAPVVPAVLVLMVAQGQRRRVALALWMLVASVGLYLEAVRRGLAPPLVASASEAGVLAALALALLAGVAVGACILDLPRRRLGFWQPVALGTIGVSVVMLAAGLLPALWGGHWEPGRDADVIEAEVIADVRAVLEAEAETEGEFRALWVGEGWFGPQPAGPAGPGHVLTGSSGPLVDDLYASGSSAGATQLRDTIAAIEQEATDRGGRLLGAFNVRFLVLLRDAPDAAWLRQRDLGVVRSEPEYLMLENHAYLPRGGVYAALPAGATRGRPVPGAAAPAELDAALARRGPARLDGEEVAGPGVAWLAETRSPRWRATLVDRELEALDGSWGNAWRVPGGFRGELVVSHPRPAGEFVWFAVASVAWLAALGAATARRAPPALRHPIKPSREGVRVTERVREWVVGGIVAALVLGGLALELLAGPEPSSPPPVEEVEFAERAEFCPPTVGVEGFSQSLVVSGGERETAVGLEPQRPEPAEVAARRIAPVALEEAGGQAVVGYGAPAYAGAVMRSTETRRAGAGAAACSGAASERWYFAAGTSAIGYDQRILLHNPFPDEAVVRVSLLTALGQPLNKAGLDDVPVPAGEYAEVDINDFIAPRAQFGAEVTAIRGRVVAWKAVIGAARESPHGMELTVGAPEPALRWYFPHGVIGSDVEETIALLNPNDRELTVTVSLASEREAAQPAALIDVPLPPRSSHLVSLAESAPPSIAGRRVGVSVTVSSTNGLPLVAERRLSGAGRDGEGVASELGATSGADAWLLPPAAEGGEDDLVSLMNPSDRDARASLRLVFADRAALSPPPLQRVEVGAGLRTEINLDRWRSAGLAGVLVTSDAPLVAERSAYSPAAKDMADVMGRPLSPKEP